MTQTPDLPDDDEWTPRIPREVLGQAIHNLDAEKQLGEMMELADRMEYLNLQRKSRKKDLEDIRYFLLKYVASGNADNVQSAKLCCEILEGKLRIETDKGLIISKEMRAAQMEKERQECLKRRQENKSDG